MLHNIIITKDEKGEQKGQIENMKNREGGQLFKQEKADKMYPARQFRWNRQQPRWK